MQTITVNVDVAKLTSSPPPSVESCCTLSFGGTTYQPEDTITISKNDEVEWVGADSSSNGDSVDIERIDFKNPPASASKNSPFASEDFPPGAIRAIRDSANKYEVRFKINGRGKLYKLDPWLGVNN